MQRYTSKKILRSTNAETLTNEYGGFTLIEMLVVLFSFTLIVYGVAGIVSNLLISTSKQTGLLSDTDQARKVTNGFVNELRDAQTGSNGSYALDTASAQQIIFYSNIDSDPYMERIRYFIQNGQLYKGMTKYNGSTYNTASEAVTVVEQHVANGSNPLFLYYDDTYTGGSAQSPLAQPVNVTQVKFVQMILQIYNTAGKTGTNTFTVSAGAAIRNLKTNLGE